MPPQCAAEPRRGCRRCRPALRRTTRRSRVPSPEMEAPSDPECRQVATIVTDLPAAGLVSTSPADRGAPINLETYYTEAGKDYRAWSRAFNMHFGLALAAEPVGARGDARGDEPPGVSAPRTCRWRPPAPPRLRGRGTRPGTDRGAFGGSDGGDASAVGRFTSLRSSASERPLGSARGRRESESFVVMALCITTCFDRRRWPRVGDRSPTSHFSRERRRSPRCGRRRRFIRRAGVRSGSRVRCSLEAVKWKIDSLEEFFVVNVSGYCSGCV